MTALTSDLFTSELIKVMAATVRRSALDLALHKALVRWAAEELRSSIHQIEILVRDAWTWAGRLQSSRPRLRRKAG